MLLKKPFIYISNTILFINIFFNYLFYIYYYYPKLIFKYPFNSNSLYFIIYFYYQYRLEENNKPYNNLYNSLFNIPISNLYKTLLYIITLVITSYIGPFSLASLKFIKFII